MGCADMKNGVSSIKAAMINVDVFIVENSYVLKNNTCTNCYKAIIFVAKSGFAKVACSSMRG
jgi:hypothetical protein